MGSVGDYLYFLPGGTSATGDAPYDNGNKVFHEGYHPNADTWTTARTITIGNTGKSVNGSADVSWSLSEIGAAASSHTHSEYLLNNADDITSGSLTVGSTLSTSNKSLRVLAGDSYIASIEAFGGSQGTGKLYVGQASNYGGGIMYNGDDNPNLPQTSDAISFYRRTNNTEAEVFSYPHNSSVVTFTSDIVVNGGNITLGGTGRIQGVDTVSAGTDAANKTYVDNAVAGVSYTHPTHPGDDINLDTGALTGATVISDLDFNVTTDTLGHVTDANATYSTRNLTASDLGIASTELVKNYQNVDYVASDPTSSGSRANYGTGVTVYEGYSVGTNRPHTYDATVQFMPTSAEGFELSADWVSSTTTPLKIRSLRDCCQGWSPWRDISVAEDPVNGNFIFADKVSVGKTSAPVETLDVAGTGKFTSYLSFNNQGYIRGDSSGELRLQGGTSATTFYNSSNSSELMRITQGGNVGIGTTGPSQKLHVAGTGLFSSTLYLGDTNCALFRYLNTFIITNTGATTISLGGGPGNVNNNVLVGNGFLDVNGYIRGKNYFYLEDTTGNVKATLRTESTYSTFDHGTNNINTIANIHMFLRGFTEIMRIHSNNNVGIGTTSPGEKLEVNGTVKATAATDAYKGYIKNTITCTPLMKSANTSYNYIPYNTTIFGSTPDYFNRMVAPYDGRVKKIILRHISGTTPTATGMKFKKEVNGTVSTTEYTATVTGGASTSFTAIYNFANSDFTFSEGDSIGILAQTSGGTGNIGGASVQIIVEYNIT